MQYFLSKQGRGGQWLFGNFLQTYPFWKKKGLPKEGQETWLNHFDWKSQFAFDIDLFNCSRCHIMTSWNIKFILKVVILFMINDSSKICLQILNILGINQQQLRFFWAEHQRTADPLEFFFVSVNDTPWNFYQPCLGDLLCDVCSPLGLLVCPKIFTFISILG